MAFAQLTYRESLRDIEACRAMRSKLFHMGISTVSRNNLPMPTRGATGASMGVCLLIAEARRLYTARTWEST